MQRHPHHSLVFAYTVLFTVAAGIIGHAQFTRTSTPQRDARQLAAQASQPIAGARLVRLAGTAAPVAPHGRASGMR